MDHLPRHEHRNLSPKATSGMDRMIAPFLSAKICSSSSFSGRIKVPFSYNADARPLDKKPTFQQESVRNWPPWGAKSVRVLRAEASGPSSKIFAPATLRALRPLFGLSCACSKAAAAQKRKSAKAQQPQPFAHIIPSEQAITHIKLFPSTQTSSGIQ